LVSLYPELYRFLDRAQKLLQAAEHLYNGGYYESCISRLYYSVFIAAPVLLEAKVSGGGGRYIRQGRQIGWRVVSKHETAQNDFSTHFVNRGYFTKREGELYVALISAREGADYGLAGYPEGLVRDLLERTRQLVTKITEMAKDA